MSAVKTAESGENETEEDRPEKDNNRTATGEWLRRLLFRVF